jgi:hypothetical protein
LGVETGALCFAAQLRDYVHPREYFCLSEIERVEAVPDSFYSRPHCMTIRVCTSASQDRVVSRLVGLQLTSDWERDQWVCAVSRACALQEGASLLPHAPDANLPGLQDQRPLLALMPPQVAEESSRSPGTSIGSNNRTSIEIEGPCLDCSPGHSEEVCNQRVSANDMCM